MGMMSSTYLNRALSLVAFILLSFSVLAQELIFSGRINDLNNQALIAGVKITVHESGLITYSDSLGAFKLPLRPGHYHIHFEKEGYIAQDLNLDHPAVQSLTIQLIPSSIELDELLIEDQFFKLPNANFSQDLTSIRLDEQEQANQIDLANILEEQAGLSALNTGVGISKPIIRGFSGNRVAVIDQGIKQEGQQWGMDHGLEIDPFQVQRVELVKGPAALQYGSDAIAGAIRILPPSLAKEGWSAELRSNYHSNNRALGNSVATDYRKGALALGLRLSQRNYQDFRVPAETFVYNGFVLPITDNTLKNTAGALQSAQSYLSWNTEGYRARYLISAYQQNQGLYPGATGIPRAFDVGNIGDTKDIDLPFQSIGHYKVYTIQNIKIGKHWLEAEMGYQFNDRKERSLPHAHGFEELDSGATLALGLKLHSLQANLRYRFHWRAIDLIAGTAQQYQSNESRGFEYLIPNYTAYQSGVFLLANGKLHEQLHWDGGLRWEYKRQQSPLSTTLWWQDIDSIVVRSPELDRQFSNFAAAAGMVYRPSDKWRLKWHLARSFRAPNVAELSSNGVHHGTFRHEVGNTNLNPEIAWQVDWSASYQNENFLIRFSPFYYYFENFIFLRPTASFSSLPEAGQLYEYQQAPAIQSGAELYFDWHPWSKLHFSNASELILNTNLNTQLPLPFSPPASNLTSLNWEEDQWQLGFSWRYTAAQNRVDRNEAESPQYHLFHLNGSYQFKWRKQELRLHFGLRNIFDQFYLRHLSRYRILNLPEQGRNVIFGISWQM